ncbi:hypothetical protein [Methanococcus voltae]|uniref:Uncharacterized protein n=1 Tax=Methanococcus voltae (strain ATCC BAA-1334 / A3) TaxID=456320 RepID=D7DTR8_METV3|nr:hypothetical protein [Methanococcus voltae]MCS3901382.1 hypothetical protein [Methanococcus voltae]
MIKKYFKLTIPLLILLVIVAFGVKIFGEWSYSDKYDDVKQKINNTSNEANKYVDMANKTYELSKKTIDSAGNLSNGDSVSSTLTNITDTVSKSGSILDKVDDNLDSIDTQMDKMLEVSNAVKEGKDVKSLDTSYLDSENLGVGIYNNPNSTTETTYADENENGILEEEESNISIIKDSYTNNEYIYSNNLENISEINGSKNIYYIYEDEIIENIDF